MQQVLDEVSVLLGTMLLKKWFAVIFVPSEEVGQADWVVDVIAPLG